MSFPDFEKAEYTQPQVIEGEVLGRPIEPDGGPALPLAVVYGAVAALIGSVGYAMVASLGFMISIVAIGIAWLIVKAMMTASGGVGGRPYQIVAAAFTYFAVSWGDLLRPLWTAHQRGASVASLANPVVFKFALLGPFLELQDGLNGILGIIILGIGVRYAWRLAAGSPGFGTPGRTRPVDPFGLR